MNGSLLALLAAAAVLVPLTLWYRRLRSNDLFDAIILRRKATSKISSRAELVDGANHIPVALTLESSRIIYENPDLEADLDLSAIDEVEYGAELITGARAAGPVLRLRSRGGAVEFILDGPAAQKWQSMLPPHRIDEAGSVHAN